MVHVTFSTEGTGESVADAIYRWAQTYPGDEILTFSVAGRDWQNEGEPVEWPNRVNASVGAVTMLSSMIAEHCERYDIRVRPDLADPSGSAVSQPWGIAKLGAPTRGREAFVKGQKPVGLLGLRRKLADWTWKPRFSVGFVLTLVLIHETLWRLVPYVWNHL